MVTNCYHFYKNHNQNEKEAEVTSMPIHTKKQSPKPKTIPFTYDTTRFSDPETDSLDRLYNTNNPEYNFGQGQWDDDDSWGGYYNE